MKNNIGSQQKILEEKLKILQAANAQLSKEIERTEKESTQLISSIYRTKREREIFEDRYIKITRSRMWHKTQKIREFIDGIKSGFSQGQSK